MPRLRCSFMASTEEFELLAAGVGDEPEGAAEGRLVAVPEVWVKYRRIQLGMVGPRYRFDGHLLVGVPRGLRIWFYACPKLN